MQKKVKYRKKIYVPSNLAVRTSNKLASLVNVSRNDVSSVCRVWVNNLDSSASVQQVRPRLSGLHILKCAPVKHEKKNCLVIIILWYLVSYGRNFNFMINMINCIKYLTRLLINFQMQSFLIFYIRFNIVTKREKLRKCLWNCICILPRDLLHKRISRSYSVCYYWQNTSWWKMPSNVA